MGDADDAPFSPLDAVFLVVEEFGTDLDSYVEAVQQSLNQELVARLGHLVPDDITSEKAYDAWADTALKPGSDSRRMFAQEVAEAILVVSAQHTNAGGKPRSVETIDGIPRGVPAGGQIPGVHVPLPASLLRRAKRERGRHLAEIVDFLTDPPNRMPFRLSRTDSATASAIAVLATSITAVEGHAGREERYRRVYSALSLAWAATRIELGETQRCPMPSLVVGDTPEATDRLLNLCRSMSGEDIYNAMPGVVSELSVYLGGTLGTGAPTDSSEVVDLTVLSGVAVALAEQIIDPPLVR